MKGRGTIGKRLGPLVLVAWACLAASATETPVVPDAAPPPPAERPAAPTGGRPLTRLQGSAFLDRNNDVVGATVIVRPDGPGGLVYLTSTDERGQFRIEDLPDGTYQVRFEREGLASVIKRGIEVRHPFRAIVEVGMQPADAGAQAAPPDPPAASPETTVEIRGSVTGSTGKPLDEVRVHFTRPGGAFDPRVFLTDADGEFVAAELAAGTWRVEVEGVGYLPMRALATLEADITVRVALVEQPPDYHPTPLELMPPEQPIPPPEPPGSPPDGKDAGPQSAEVGARTAK